MLIKPQHKFFEEISLSDESDIFIRSKLEQIAGVHIGSKKSELIIGRLRKRLIELELNSVDDYVHYLKSLPAQHQEWQNFVNELTTNKTDFFREIAHFKFLEDTIVPKLSKNKLVHLWSAACSSGEEPYSLAAVLNKYASREHFRFHITASDIDSRIIAVAKNGVYPLSSVPEYMHAHYRDMFTIGTGDLKKWIRINNILRSAISFEVCNLINLSFTWPHKFDVIFCRNVFIYFTPKTIEQVCRNMFECANKGSYLIIGHSESLHNVSIPWTQVKPSVYIKA